MPPPPRWRCLVVLAWLGLCTATGCRPAPDPDDGGVRGASAAAVQADVALPAGLPLVTVRPEGLSGRLVFQSDREGRDKLYILDLGSGAVTALTTGRDHRDEDASWSPDGTHVAFATTRFDSRTYGLAVTDTRTGEVLPVEGRMAFDRQPAWMPGGESLLYASERDGTQAIFRVWLDGRPRARVSHEPERALMPEPSPDGRQLAYTRGTTGGLQIALQDMDSGVSRLLTHVPDGAARPRWSPDGRRLAYTRLRRAGTFVEGLDPASGEVTSLAVAGLDELADPAWSPDGQWLVASGAAAGDLSGWDLILMSLGPDAAAYRLTTGRGDDRAPSWSPR